MEAEIRVWALIGVVIAGGGIATALLLHPMASLGESRRGRSPSRCARLRLDALGNKIDVEFDLLSSRIDGLVTEAGHLNKTFAELVGKAHTHGRVA